MNSTQKKTYLAFNEGILSVHFFENAVIDVEDVIYIYCYAIEKSKGKPYGLLFDSSSKHEFTANAIEYFVDSPYLKDVIAIAYISKDLISKIRLNLLLIFERPAVKPKIFGDETLAYDWLQKKVNSLTVNA
ncbi:DUF7793 family protein [Aurantibacillus circumpalustris]|uniref:DUF7793 family protein n=1 Tax=Aurantibacillus circumpalustris TaxID=3036359 RepID=UPI00295BBF42|nr:hypothetical protein [Aurantibacillus circumpalustris]